MRQNGTISPTVLQHDYTGNIMVAICGLMFLGMAIGVHVTGQSRAEEYQTALANYHYRRRMLQEKTGSKAPETPSPKDYLS